MKRYSILFASAFLSLIVFHCGAQGTAFTYQGRLNANGAPANGTYDILFRPFGVSTGGSQLTIPITRFVIASNGLFTTAVDFGSAMFDGTVIYLQLEVRTNGGPSYATLTPRQPVSPAPYAIMASSIINGAVDTLQLAAGAVTAGKLASNSVTSGKIAAGAVDTAELANGAVTTAKLASNAVTSAKVSTGTLIPANLDVDRFNTTFWRTAGNSNTTPGTHFIGTTDATPFEIHVNGDRAFRVVPDGYGAHNIVAGAPVNRVLNAAVGATIAGGGQTHDSILDSVAGTNEVTGYFGTIGGGKGNRSDRYATVGGGWNNLATGYAATVPGGGNVARAEYSFAAGRNAKADDIGSFVWADYADIYNDFHSSFANGFFIRCTGGARIVTAIDGSGNGTAGVRLGSGDSAWSTISDRDAKKNFQAVDAVSVLNKLVAMPIAQWNYKWEADTNTPNLGPMAQDFKAAFYPGRDDKSISTLEFDGVALAAIQGLNQKLADELKRRDAENNELRRDLAELKRTVERLAHAPKGGIPQ